MSSLHDDRRTELLVLGCLSCQHEQGSIRMKIGQLFSVAVGNTPHGVVFAADIYLVSVLKDRLTDRVAPSIRNMQDVLELQIRRHSRLRGGLDGDFDSSNPKHLEGLTIVERAKQGGERCISGEPVSIFGNAIGYD